LALSGVNGHIDAGSLDGWELQNSVHHNLDNAFSRVFPEASDQSVEEFSVNHIELLASFERVSDGHERIQESVGFGVEISSLKSRVEDDSLDAFKNIESALRGGVDLCHVSDAETSEESLKELTNVSCFVHGNILFIRPFKNSGELGIHKANSSADQSGKILSSSIRLLVQNINNSFADKLFHSGVKKEIAVDVMGDSRVISVSVVFKVRHKFKVSLGAFGSDLILKDLNGGDGMSKSAHKILALHIVLEVLDRGRKSINSLVEAVKTIVHDSVLGLDIHGDGVDESAVEFGDFGHVDLSGQSQDS